MNNSKLAWTIIERHSIAENSRNENIKIINKILGRKKWNLFENIIGDPEVVPERNPIIDIEPLSTGSDVNTLRRRFMRRIRSHFFFFFLVQFLFYFLSSQTNIFLGDRELWTQFWPRNLRAKDLRTEVVNGGLGSEKAEGERECYVYDPRNATEGPRKSFGFRSGANVTKRISPGSVWLLGNSFFFLFG